MESQEKPKLGRPKQQGLKRVYLTLEKEDIKALNEKCPEPKGKAAFLRRAAIQAIYE
jgi:hypothetical protein